MRIEKINSRNILTTCFVVIVALCLSLAGLFALPVKASVTSTACEVSSCSGTYDEEGVCSAATYHYQAATLTTDKHDVTGDGETDAVYEIGNYGQYMWFASQVNAGTGRSWNAKLTANIDFADVTYSWENLGTRTYANYKTVSKIGGSANTPYSGVFDGNYMKLNGVKIENSDDPSGIFGVLKDGTVKNLKVVDADIISGVYTGGLVGTSDGGTIENCGVTAKVVTTDFAGGIVGYAEDTTIKNSWANITSTSNGAGGNGGVIGKAYGTNTVTNCYYLFENATAGYTGDDVTGSAIAVTAEQIKSGELAYMLGKPWGQTVDKAPTNIFAIMWCQIDPNFICEFDLSDIDGINELDETAVYNYTLPVYKTLSCDGLGAVVYTNTKASETLASHAYDYDGFCRVCDNAYEPATRTTDKWDINEDGTMDAVYEITNEGQLYWFAQQVNSGNSAINGVLYPKMKENFVLNPGTINADGTYTASSNGESVRSWTPIGQTTSRFAGLFDGRGYVISGLYADVNNEYNGLFGITDGAAIFNVGVEDSWIGGVNYCGAVVGKALDTTIGYCYANAVTVGIAMRYNAGLVGYLENSELYNSWCNINSNSHILGVLTAYLDNSTMRDCYTSTKRDYYYEKCNNSTVKNCAQVTEEQFASGEVAYLLGSPWGQDIDAAASGKDALPVWGGETVYQNLVENGACDGFVYSNTKTTVDESTLTHNYDVTTGVCSGCEKQAEAKIGDVVYETLTEALAAVPTNGTDQTVITLLTDVLFSGNLRIQNKNVKITGNHSIYSEYNYNLVSVFSGTVELENIIIENSAESESAFALYVGSGGIVQARSCTFITNNASAVVSVSGGTFSEINCIFEGGIVAIKYSSMAVATNITISSNIYANYPDAYGIYGNTASYGTTVITLGVGLTRPTGVKMFLDDKAKVIVNLGNNEICNIIERESDGVFAYAADHVGGSVGASLFKSNVTGKYIQTNADGNLYIAPCDHNAWELEYEKVANNTLTETCSVCGAVNTIVLKAPDNLVYDGQAKAAYTTGEFFNEEMPSITYCCADGCKIHNNGTAHTATLTFESYTLQVEFVIEKAPGIASVTIDSYGVGENESVPRISSVTNGSNGYTVYYKVMGADDSTYTTAGTDVNNLNMPSEQGAYTLKVVLNATANYTEATAYANFAVGGELPDYTVPENLTAVYGQRLADVAIPDGWTWKDSTLSVGSVGRNTFAAVYDSGVDGEIAVECIVTIEVAKANQTITLSKTEFTYAEKMTIDFGALIETVGDGATTYTIQKSNVAFTFDFAKGILSNLTRAGGTFTLTVTKAATDNYNEATQAFTITLNKQTVNEPTIASKGWTGETLTADVPSNNLYAVTTNNGGTAKGDYKVVLTLVNAHLYKWATTDEASVTLTFTITAQVNAWTTAPSINGWTYGQSANTPTYAAKYGTVVVDYRLASGTDADYTTTVPTNAGAYKVRFTVEVTENYSGLLEVVDFTIAKAKPTVNSPTVKTGLTYTAEAQTLITAGSTTGGTMQYKVGDDGAWSENLPTATNVGTYKIYYKVVGDGNYNDANGGYVSVTIAKKNVTVTADDKTVAQFGAMPQFTYTVTGVIETNYSFVTAPIAGVVIKDTNTHGTYTITVSGGKDTNYNFVYYPGTLTITEHPHDYSELIWNETEHWYICSVCDKEQPNGRTEHSGGTATCQVKAICSTCYQEYGSVGGHSYDESAWGYKGTDGHAHVCTVNGCDAHDAVVGHTPNVDTATEDVAKYCTVCQFIIEQRLDHVHVEGTEWEYNSEYHWHDCVGDDGQEYSKAKHSYDNDCDTTCNVCLATRTITHNYTKLEKSATEHWYVCSVCDAEKPNSRTGHSGGTSNCQTKAECATCGQIYGDLGAHVYDTTVWVSVNDGHHAHKCTLCVAYTDNTDHFSADEATCEDEKLCEDCGHKMEDAHGHSYTECIKTDAYLKEVGKDCQTAYTYYYACEHCGESSEDDTNTFYESDIFGEHKIAAVWTTDYDAENNHGYHYHECTVEGCDYRENGGACVGGNATCTELAICSTCQKKYGTLAEHEFGSSWEYKDAAGHAHVCTAKGCNVHDDITDHTPNIPAATEESAQYCTACEYQMAAQLNHTHSPATAWSSNGTHHWKACGGCEAHLDETTHSYANDCDTTCEVCEYERIVTHDFTGEWEKDASGHWRVCTKNGCTVTDTKQNHVSAGAATESDPEVCSICCWVINPALGHTTHTAETEWQNNDTHHWNVCTGCSGQELNKAAHKDGDNNGSCDACGYTMTVTPPDHTHSHGTTWVTDADKHWNECECGDKANKASHVDGDGDGKCDTCNEAMSSGTGTNLIDPRTQNIPDSPDTPDEGDGGLGTGAIVAIVICSVVGVGGGGFALFWFVIKKRRF